MSAKWLDFLLSRRYALTVMGDPLPAFDPAPSAMGSNARKPGQAPTQSKTEPSETVQSDTHMPDPGQPRAGLAEELRPKPPRPHTAHPHGGPFLILPNQPALIDPLIVYSHFAPLAPRLLMTAPHARALRFFAPGADIIVLPSAAEDGTCEQSAVETALSQAAQCLAEGRSLILWPAGQLQSKAHEKLSSPNIAEQLFDVLPQHGLSQPELFLVRLEGLWGSQFSRYFAPEGHPKFFSTLCRQIPALLLGPLLPHRPVRMVVRRHKLNASHSCTAHTGQEHITSILNTWYDAGTEGATLVPRMPMGRIQRMPMETRSAPSAHMPQNADKAPLQEAGSPAAPQQHADTPATQGAGSPNDSQNPLAEHSPLAAQESAAPTDSAPAYIPPPPIMAAGATDSAPPLPIFSPATRAIDNNTPLADIAPVVPRTPPLIPIQHALTRQGTVTDVNAGLHFSRRTLLGLAKAIGTLLGPVPASRIGLALPAGAGAMAAYIAILDCILEDDRVPVLLNLDFSPEQLAHCAQETGITHVITCRQLQGRGLPPDSIPLYLEDITQAQIMRGCALSFMGFAGNTDVDAPAAMVFTAGSTGQPKALILSHTNLLTSLCGLLSTLMSAPVNAHALSLLCCMPPHTPLGLLTNIILPLTCGVPAVTLADPTDADLLARTAANYGVNCIVGTTDIFTGMLREARTHLPFRFALCSQQTCPDTLRERFAKVCPHGQLLECYSLAEGSALTLNARQQPGSVGTMLPGMAYALHQGQLYVRGENICAGYFNGDDPRTTLPHMPEKDWFPTGDMFEADAQDFLFWKGRQSTHQGL